jgi:hypothetical protein
MGQCMVKYLGGKIFRLGAIMGAAGDERVHTLEVALVQVREAAPVRLGGLDQKALVITAQGGLRRRGPWLHGLIPYNGRNQANVTVGVGGIATPSRPIRR